MMWYTVPSSLVTTYGHPADTTHVGPVSTYFCRKRNGESAGVFGSDRIEFQMLHGVDASLQARSRGRISHAHRYSYGREWFRYFMRRLGEAPPMCHLW